MWHQNGEMLISNGMQNGGAGIAPEYWSFRIFIFTGNVCRLLTLFIGLLPHFFQTG